MPAIWQLCLYAISFQASAEGAESAEEKYSVNVVILPEQILATRRPDNADGTKGGVTAYAAEGGFEIREPGDDEVVYQAESMLASASSLTDARWKGEPIVVEGIQRPAQELPSGRTFHLHICEEYNSHAATPRLERAFEAEFQQVGDHVKWLLHSTGATPEGVDEMFSPVHYLRRNIRFDYEAKHQTNIAVAAEAIQDYLRTLSDRWSVTLTEWYGEDRTMTLGIDEEHLWVDWVGVR